MNTTVLALWWTHETFTEELVTTDTLPEYQNRKARNQATDQLMIQGEIYVEKNRLKRTERDKS